LTRYIACDFGFAAFQPRSINLYRWTNPLSTFHFLQGLNVATQLFQRLHQIANGTFAHAGVAVKDVFAMTEGEKSGEETSGGPCVADEEFGFGCRNPSAQAGDGHFVIRFIQLNVEAESLERVRKTS
jgi:hypothetical protein